MHSLCFSGVHCIICDVRFQNEKNIQASETAGGASLAVDLPECSFLLYPISCFLSGLVSRVFSAQFLLTWKLPGRQWFAFVGESVGVKWQNAHF